MPYNDDEYLRRLKLAHIRAISYRSPKSKERAFGAHLAGALLAVAAECDVIARRRKRERRAALAPAALFGAAQASIIERVTSLLIHDFLLTLS